MTSPNSQPQRAGAAARWGPLVGIVAVLAIVAGVVVFVGRGKVSDGGTTGAGSVVPATASDVPITYDEAKAQGKTADYTWGDNCDTTTGRIKMPSNYAPPCLPKYNGNNGGATSIGVSADQITIVVYRASANSDLSALLEGKLDPPEAVAETTAKFTAMAGSLYETYGRKVTFVPFDATGGWTDAAAAKADAIKVSEEIKPFASLGGPTLTPVYAEELAERGILCIGCGIGFPDAFQQKHKPYIWGLGASPEQFLVNIGDYVVNRLVGRKATFAGDSLKDKDRKFGIIHFEQNPPVFTELGEEVRAAGAVRGFEAAPSEAYEFDLGKMNERATTIIAKMKDQGVTSILFLGDPLMPIYLTRAATAQDYFPEWIITGTALTDVTVTGRFVDQQQYRHAFGLSALPARMPRELGDSWSLHKWFYGSDPVAHKTQAILWAPLDFLFRGIHMAGPKLTPATFEAGLFKFPQSGGGVTNPHVSYGDHGYFKKFDGSVRTDYNGVDDMTEIWWDADAEGPDEQGVVAKGLWTYANGGKRYLPGQGLKTDADAFKKQGSVTVLAKPPPEDAPPSYPPPPGSPAAAVNR